MTLTAVEDAIVVSVAGRVLKNTYFEAETGCWIWSGSKDAKGYPRVSVGGKNLRAHRVSYAMFIGPIPEGLTIDHTCRNRACVSPFHLEAVTLRDNIMRGRGVGVINAAKTHCPHGHPYDDENTYYTSLGHRQCRACKVEIGRTKDWAAEWQRRKARSAPAE